MTVKERNKANQVIAKLEKIADYFDKEKEVMWADNGDMYPMSEPLRDAITYIEELKKLSSKIKN